jgi:hypothetical protein
MSRFVDRQAAVEVQPDVLLYWVSLADAGGTERTSRVPFVPRQYVVFIDIVQFFVCTAFHVYDRPAGAEPLLTRPLEEGVLAPGDRVAVCISDDGRGAEDESHARHQFRGGVRSTPRRSSWDLSRGCGQSLYSTSRVDTKAGADRHGALDHQYDVRPVRPPFRGSCGESRTSTACRTMARS